MKKIFSFVMVLISVTLMLACTNEKDVKTNEAIKATLISPDGLPSFAISKSLSEDKKIGNIEMSYSIQKTPDLLLSELMKGKVELAVVPSNLALQAYKKNLGYKVAATIGWGSLYLVSTEEINDISELKGCEIYNTGKGLTPDIVFKTILNNNGLSEQDVNLAYVGAAAELAPMVMSGQAKYAVLPEPALSTVMSKNNKVKILLNLNEEWSKINNVEKGYPQSTLLIKEEFYNTIKDNGQYEEIINKLKDSEEWAINNPQLAADKCEELGITVNKEVIDKSIKNSNLSFTKIEDCTTEYEKYFSIIDNEGKGEEGEYEAIFIKK